MRILPLRSVQAILALALMTLCLGSLPSAAQLADEVPAVNASSAASISSGTPITRQTPASAITAPRPFSRFAVGVDLSTLGIRMQTASYLSPHLNLRASGSVFGFTDNNISTNGFNVDAHLHLSSAGISVDYFPFAAHGWKLSPGILFYNDSGAEATFTAQPGTSFSLNGYTYYSSGSDPVRGNGTAGLHTHNPAFTITTGWGNMIPHKGHFSFPFEIGVAFIGAPAFDMALTSGQVCDSNGQNCVNVATDPTVQANLRAQVIKYRNDLEPLKTYPLISGGITYCFQRRR
ncbi:MAG: hypothetical protein QJR10_05245 [Bacillota bacterium]|nr:hypothetical protein [Bacillota bacterium]